MTNQPANRNVLLLESIHTAASDTFEDRGFTVSRRPGSLTEDELIEALQGQSMVGLRSNTKVTEKVLDNTNLSAIGAFCIGTNQIDLEAASSRGIAVFNAPYSNTRSVVELVIGEIIALARRLNEKTQRMHDGVWDKSAQGSHEVRGRTLGIIGYGNIGTQLSNLAEAIGMRVIFFDTADKLAHGNARRMRTMDDLLANADVVSLHVDGRTGNAGLFGEEQFSKMKPRALFINASRGMVVDEQALAAHIKSGHIAGAAIDVFPVEPKAQGDAFESALRGLDNVILTPHVGGSTQEAQEEIGYFVSNKLSNFIDAGSTELSVNLPVVAAPALTSGSRVAILHHNVPGVLAAVNQILFEHHDNVLAQYLATRGELGYVVADVEGPSTDECIAQIEATDWNHWVRTYNA